MKIKLHHLLLTLALFAGTTTQLFAQGMAFTYQGRLNSGGSPASGAYNLTFTLFNTNTGGVAIAGPVTNNAVVVTNGLFTTMVDFGPGVFTGGSNWLQIGVATNGASAFIALVPRQQLTPTPYAIYAESANAAALSGTLPVSQVSGVVPLAQLPVAVMTNFATSASLSGLFAGSFGGSFYGDGTGLTSVNAAALNGLNTSSFWTTNGNAGANPTNGAFLGTTDYLPLEFHVINHRALRIEPVQQTKISIGHNYSNVVNIVGGSSVNYIASGVNGSVISGGGSVDNYFDGLETNCVTILNSVAADFCFLGGGEGNSIQLGARFSVLGGGYTNSIQTNAIYSFLGGGDYNSIQTNAYESVLGGGGANSIQTNSYDSVLGGGYGNSIQTNANSSFLGGGWNNSIQANANHSVLGGGWNNSIQPYAYQSFLGGGYSNSIQANAYFSFLGGGTNNFIQPNAFDATLGGGANNQVGGAGATVPGGNGNAANGVNSFAAGTDAQALYNGDFVLTDCHYTDFASAAANQFCARFYGGYQLYSGASSGVQVAAGGGSWTSLSDRNAKEAFEPVNAQVVLDKVAALPLSTWKYKSQDASIRHIGPMAQDFKAAFGVGETDTGITTVDADGVALAAIQGLNQKVEEQSAQMKAKDAEIQDLKARLEKLEQVLETRNGGGQ